MWQLLYFSEEVNPSVDWVFRYFSLVLGCAFQRTTELHRASVVYANRSEVTGQLCIPVWREYYQPAAEHCLNRGGYWVPREMRDTEMLIDYVGLTFRLLCLCDELALPSHARDASGNLSSSYVFPRMDLGNRPMVDEALSMFKQTLVERGLLPASEFQPRWPDGKQYALLMTHDTDGPCLLEFPELAKAGLKGFIKGNRREREAFWAGSRQRLTGGPDPYFNFASWAAFEQTLDARSAFYLYAHSAHVPGHIHNPPYHLKKSRAKWDILRELSQRGWEIGLHTSIHAIEDVSYIQAEKRKLEDFLGQAVAGSRSHYWRINWQNPEESFRRLQEAGLSYDCSMAWRTAPGFRSGTALPYYPFDSSRGQGFDLLEIPTSVMDGHLFQYQAESDAHSLFTAIVKQVKECGGVLNLDWHTRTWVNRFSYTDWRRFLVQELQEIASTGEAWFTTPGKLADHWRQRAQFLSTSAAGYHQAIN